MFKNAIDYMIEMIFTGYLDSVSNSLTKNIFTGSFAEAWGFVSDVMNELLIPIGIYLMVIYFIASLIDKSSSGQLNFEVFFKCFIQLVVAALLVTNLIPLVNLILSVGHSLILQLGDLGSIKDTVSVAEDVKKLLWADGDGFKVQIKYFFPMIVPFLFSYIVRWGILLISYTRVIELMVVTMFMPLCMGDIFTEGIHGAAMRNIKRLFAVSLQGFGVYATCVLFTFIQKGFITQAGVFEMIGTTVVLGAACLATCFKILPMIKDALGVH